MDREKLERDYKEYLQQQKDKEDLASGKIYQAKEDNWGRGESVFNDINSKFSEGRSTVLSPSYPSHSPSHSPFSTQMFTTCPEENEEWGGTPLTEEEEEELKAEEDKEVYTQVMRHINRMEGQERMAALNKIAEMVKVAVIGETDE